MKSTHNKLRALAKSLGLALLLVTGAAVMMSALSNQTSPVTPDDFYRPAASEPALKAAQQTAFDSLLYQHITQTDGTKRWVLLEETQTLAFAPASRDILMVDGPVPDTARLSKVSYTLEAKPAGWNRVLQNCSLAEVGQPQGVAAAYDIACARLG